MACSTFICVVGNIFLFTMIRLCQNVSNWAYCSLKLLYRELWKFRNQTNMSIPTLYWNFWRKDQHVSSHLKLQYNLVSTNFKGLIRHSNIENIFWITKRIVYRFFFRLPDYDEEHTGCNRLADDAHISLALDPTMYL